MDLINATNMMAAYTMGMEPSGREILVVAIKGTFNIPQDGSEPQLMDEQVPLVDADVYTGEPGHSAPLYEVDYAPYKSRCDVLLNGSAYAPGGKPVKKMSVRLRVGLMVKEFDVIGDRVWQVRKIGYRQSSPQPFTEMPISYNRAFGGSDDKHPDTSKHSAYMPNTAGRGYHVNKNRELMDNAPLPNTEERGKPVIQPAGNYRPMSFGVIARNWEPRYRLAGTYDQDWIDNVFPFLPADFNAAYYQAAPVDQQIDFLKGNEMVELINLTPQGKTVFHLPKHEIPVTFFLKKGGKDEKQAMADTLVLEPDLGRFTITWRAHIPLKKNMFEVPQILAGKKSRGWWRARELGKTYYPSLKAFIDSKRKEAKEAEE